ncbi:conserved hypothetical protein [Beggiatoa sp. PS]|nr:conserved hypothetical protein [Beggiatoa sp. PS]
MVRQGFLPKILQTENLPMFTVQHFVDAQLYRDEKTVIQEALRHLLRARPELRIQLAIYRFQTENLSLAKVASLTGVSWAQMKDILIERGISPHTV